MTSDTSPPVAPTDDGACDHLTGMTLASCELQATSGQRVNLAALRGCTVVFAYPRTSRPGEPPPSGWDEIPGARGCTPQSCAFRDHHSRLQELGARTFGLSTQDSDYQREAVRRLALNFELLSDSGCLLADAMRLPTFNVDGMRLMRRMTMIVRDGRIDRVFYPVFPAEQNAEEIIAYLQACSTS